MKDILIVTWGIAVFIKFVLASILVSIDEVTSEKESRLQRYMVRGLYAMWIPKLKLKQNASTVRIVFTWIHNIFAIIGILTFLGLIVYLVVEA